MIERIKVMQIIARMNVGGPAVIVAELMRGLDTSSFEMDKPPHLQQLKT